MAQGTLDPIDETRQENAAQPPRYTNIQDVPTDLLAHNFVGTLILAKGNLNKYDELTKMLIRQLRGEPDPNLSK